MIAGSLDETLQAVEIVHNRHIGNRPLAEMEELNERNKK
ncbi:Uncharacterised protein [Serratia fonticola]|nr:Uncharacterised protein [Serratia fonticola]